MNMLPFYCPIFYFIINDILLLQKTKTLLHRVHKKCMALHPQTQQLSLMPCDINNTYQQWSFHQIHPKW